MWWLETGPGQRPQDSKLNEEEEEQSVSFSTPSPSSVTLWRRLFYFYNFYWSIFDLQSCVSFRCTVKWISQIYTYNLLFLNYFPIYVNQIRSDQSLSRVWLFATPWIAARQASLSITNSRSSLRLTSIESVMPSRHYRVLNRIPCAIQ